MELAFILQYTPVLASATATTIGLSLVALVAGGLIGLGLAVVRILAGSVTDSLLGLLIDVVRTTPLLVQMLIWYLVPSALGMPVQPFTAAVVALSVNAGAFISEIVRGAVRAVPAGQREAALSIGLSAAYSIFGIELPQALPAIVPALISLYIGLIKDTSLAYIVGLLELTRTGAFISNQNFRPLETFTVVAVIYFVICFPVSRVGILVDRRLRRSGLAQEHIFA